MALGPQLTALLARYGLSSLTKWASDAVIRGLSEDEIALQLRDRPEFKAAFPEIEAREQLIKTTQGALAPLSPDEIIELRDSYRGMMRSYGLPPAFWDNKSDMFDLIVNDVSPDELNSRLETAVVRVQNAPPQVREVFGELFGADGDTALFSIFVDVDRALPELENMTQLAEAGGAARRFDFNLSRAQMERVSGTRVGYNQMVSAFATLDSSRSLFEETLYETEDFTVGEEGIEAAFGLEGGATEKLEQRAGTRAASTAGSGGGVREERGSTSLGGAGRR